MERSKIVNHTHGQKHAGKTDWSKVHKTEGKPVTDSENPELAYKAGKKFDKPSKIKS
jgi:hypothetical protein